MYPIPPSYERSACAIKIFSDWGASFVEPYDGSGEIEGAEEIMRPFIISGGYGTVFLSFAKKYSIGCRA